MTISGFLGCSSDIQVPVQEKMALGSNLLLEEIST